MVIDTPAAYGTYSDDAAILEVVQALHRSGFDKQDICLMISPTHPVAAVLSKSNILNGGLENGTAIIAGLMKLGAVIIPTVGFFIRSQIFLRDLVMGKDAPALCGNAAVLAGLGFSVRDAARIAYQLRETGAFVYVACSDIARTALALEILRRTGARATAVLDRPAPLEESVCLPQPRLPVDDMRAVLARTESWLPSLPLQ
jgi:hypothetical protein